MVAPPLHGWLQKCVCNLVCTAGYNTVFVKDMAYYLVDRLDTIQYLPNNYVHTFLLRDPHKSVYSLYKMSLNRDLTGRL